MRGLALAVWSALPICTLVVSACNPQTQRLLGALEDRDQDGWFSESTNAALTLTLMSGTFPVPGGYEVIVDDVRFPIAPGLDGRFPVTILQLNTPITLGPTAVATRVRGVSGFGVSTLAFGANVMLVRHEPLLPGQPGFLVGTTRVPFPEAAGTLPPVSFGGGYVLNFSVTVTPFPDPNPDDSLGDSDMDGIPEIAEARLSQRFGGLFDPQIPGRDIDLIIGAVDPSFRFSNWARQDLTSRFFQHGIRLHVDTGTVNGVAGEGGDMNLGTTGATTTGATDTMQARLVRDLNVQPGRRRFSYFALMAAFASDGTTTAFGFANGIPGDVLVMRTGFIGINDIAWYQAGVLMHELGHLLGLCHPTLSTGTGGCPAIPVPERNPGVTVMGAPSEDPNIGIAAINALRRPLDYTSTQWTQLRVGTLFPR